MVATYVVRVKESQVGPLLAQEFDLAAVRVFDEGEDGGAGIADDFAYSSSTHKTLFESGPAANPSCSRRSAVTIRPSSKTARAT